MPLLNMAHGDCVCVCVRVRVCIHETHHPLLNAWYGTSTQELRFYFLQILKGHLSFMGVGIYR